MSPPGSPEYVGYMENVETKHRASRAVLGSVKTRQQELRHGERERETKRKRERDTCNSLQIFSKEYEPGTDASFAKMFEHLNLFLAH